MYFNKKSAKLKAENINTNKMLTKSSEEHNMTDRICELADEFKPGMIDLARRAIQCPSLTGEEAKVSEIFISEMKKLC